MRSPRVSGLVMGVCDGYRERQRASSATAEARGAAIRARGDELDEATKEIEEQADA